MTELAPRLEKSTPDDRRITVIAANDPKWANVKRGGQLSADKVSFGLLARLKALHGTRPGFIYAVTSKAIYDPAVPDWRFVFGYVAYKGTNQFAAVYGTLPMRVYRPELEKARLLKMMLRYTGQMWCGLPRNSNPRSVLYQPLLEHSRSRPHAAHPAGKMPAVGSSGHSGISPLALPFDSDSPDAESDLETEAARRSGPSSFRNGLSTSVQKCEEVRVLRLPGKSSR